MAKRLAIIALAALMMFGTFGLTACNDDLAQYKTDARAEITSHVAALSADDYTTENWALIGQRANEGKAAVDAAMDTTQVDTAKTMAITAIREVLKREDLELTAELESRIKADYLQEFGHVLDFGCENLNRFYGLYSGAAVFFVANGDDALKTITISGVEFSYNCGWTIWVWKDGVFYNLENIESIFEAGILTQKNVEAIGVAHTKANEKELNQ